MVVSWPGVTGRLYDLEVTPSLEPTNWVYVPSGTNILGTDGRLYCTNFAAGNNYFYRLKVRLAP